MVAILKGTRVRRRTTGEVGTVEAVEPGEDFLLVLWGRPNKAFDVPPKDLEVQRNDHG